MTELVVTLAFLLVFQNLVRFIDLFEFCLVATLLVRMVFDRQFTERLFIASSEAVFGTPNTS